MASEEMKVEAPLYDQFLELSQRSEELLDRRGTLSDKSEVVDVAKGCMDVAKKLEDLIAAIDKLRLYSENEQLDDIATKDLRYKDQSLLKQRLEKANIRQAMESNEEELREIYLDELRLYGYRALEELSLAKRKRLFRFYLTSSLLV
ncbi:hypothetical protein D918_05012 [Trichuris suis]|nr:hypothetical protein D918_05012 [Trichuris suis]